ncbi:MAG: segregation/condensation protein A [Elusimicrobia bacterium]|nr:segregation/condensation protein A [Elusimicrobiota bacterium]
MADSVFFNRNKDAWRVQIDTFEGPLDLLLHLIRKNNMDIYDIPIAEITSEYLKYLDIIRQFHLDNVGDFLVMASILMNIKSKMLLPSDELSEEDQQDAEELKQNLVERLLEYRKYKESAGILSEREKICDGILPIQQYPLKEFGETVDVTLFDLIDSFQSLIEKARKDVKDIITEELTVDDKIRFIMDYIEDRKNIVLGELVQENSSILEIIVTILAILELVRSKQIKVKQEERFGEIYLEAYSE